MSRFSAVTSRDTPTGITVAVGAVAVVGAAFVAAAIPSVDGGWRWAVLAAVVGVVAGVIVDGPAVLAVVGLAWLVGNGFLVDRAGELSWHGWADATRVLVLLAAGALGLLAGAFGRLAREWRALARLDAAVGHMVLTQSAEEKQRA